MKAVIIIAIIAFVVYRFFKGRNEARAGRLQSYIKVARKGFGNEAIEAMEKVAYKYAAGDESEKDEKKAAEWIFRRLDAMLEVKAYWVDSVFYDYSSEITKATDFFLNDRAVRMNLAEARKVAERLFYAQEPCSVFLLQEVEALEQMGIGKVNDIGEAVRIYRKYAEQNNHFAMYRLACYGGIDAQEGAEWKRKAKEAGNLRILYDESRGNDEKRQEAMKVINYEYQKLRILYLTEMYVNESAVEKARTQLEDEMKDKTGGELSAKIDYLLEKAGWPAAVAYSEPDSPVPDEAAQKFRQARALEKEGQNFQKAAKLYLPAAEAGHVESQRRLGNILCHVRSAYDGDETDLAGRQWLEKAVAAGSILASFDLHKKDTDPAKMAAVAKTGSVEALYDLAFMIINGWGGHPNTVVGKAIAHLAWDIVGDPVKASDGEGMEWKRKIIMLGRHRTELEKDQLYWTGNAEKIGYAPGIYVLCHLPFSRKGGTAFQLEIARKAANAGYERANAVVRFLKKEKDTVEYEYKADLEQAVKTEQENNFRQGEYVALRQEWWKNKINCFRECLKQGGLPDRRDMENSLHPETAFDEEKFREELAAETPPAETTVHDMPFMITDDLGRTWERTALIGDDTAEYTLSIAEQFRDGDNGDVLNRGNVYICNRHISRNTATLFTRTFHW